MKNILITGGAGYIGSHTAVALHDAGYRPIIVDNFSNTTPSVLDGIADITGTRPQCYDGDCRDTALITTILRDENIAGIIHFAADKAVGESVENPLKYYDNNIASLVSVLRATRAINATLPFIFSSSATVYGNTTTMPLTESTPRKTATNPYGNTKAICEDILRDTCTAHTQICGISLRYFNPIGAHPSAHIGERPTGTPANLVPYLTQAAAGMRGPLTIFGNDYDTPDGTGVRDYIHVMDLAQAHVAALDYAQYKPQQGYSVFNVGTGAGTSVMELITTFERVTGVPVPYTIGARRNGDIAICYADTSYIEDTLQWRAQYTLAEALCNAWNFQQEHA